MDPLTNCRIPTVVVHRYYQVHEDVFVEETRVAVSELKVSNPSRCSCIVGDVILPPGLAAYIAAEVVIDHPSELEG
jgi:hypothetical protein